MSILYIYTHIYIYIHIYNTQYTHTHTHTRAHTHTARRRAEKGQVDASRLPVREVLVKMQLTLDGHLTI